MDTMEAETARLYELLGRHWTMGALVTNATFDAAGQAVAFALADGSLAIAPLADSDPPKDRYRMALDGGRSTISPRRNPVPPLTKVVISDASLHLASIEPSGFIASDGSQLLHVSASGVTRQAAKLGAPIDLVAPVHAGGILAASGESVIYCDSNGEVGWLQKRAGGRSSAMAVSPDGRSFAIGADGCLLVRAFGPRPEPTVSMALGSISSLSWSPDGSWLAMSVAEVGIVLLRPCRCADRPDVRLSCGRYVSFVECRLARSCYERGLPLDRMGRFQPRRRKRAADEPQHRSWRIHPRQGGRYAPRASPGRGRVQRRQGRRREDRTSRRIGCQTARWGRRPSPSMVRRWPASCSRNVRRRSGDRDVSAANLQVTANRGGEPCEHQEEIHDSSTIAK